MGHFYLKTVWTTSRIDSNGYITDISTTKTTVTTETTATTTAPQQNNNNNNRETAQYHCPRDFQVAPLQNIPSIKVGWLKEKRHLLCTSGGRGP